MTGKDLSLSEAMPTSAAPLAGEVRLSEDMRRVLWSWAALSAVSLTVAALLALVLAALRTPVLFDILPAAWGHLFRPVLVTHVVMASGVWCLAALGAMATHAIGQRRRPGPLAAAAPAGVLAGVLLMLVPTLGGGGGGEASMNDFVPVIVHPLYYAGLVCVALGVSLPIGALLRTLDTKSPFAVGVAAAGGATLVAFFCFTTAWLRLPAGLDPFTFNTMVFWGGGNILQFAYSALTLAAWYLLTERAYGEPPLSPRLFIVAIASLALFVLPAPVLILVQDLTTWEYRDTFTDLMRHGLVAGPLLVAAGALRVAWRRRRPGGNHLAAVALLTSIALFMLGGLMGFFLPGGDTRTPAHYHACLSGVNLALMGVFWDIILPVLRRPVPRSGLVRAQLALFGVGQLVFACGLFVAGLEGVPRKTAGMEQGLDTTVKLVSMGLAGAGGAVAAVGGMLFVGLLVTNLLVRPGSRR
ncbi:MAG: cbb3-type cytochrome c oxidase subunit I [Alphaproteobacteria bacterium]